ncbi:MAG: ABC transporter permease [Acidobacteria bacterium]|nr:ABC transporter permease [Acidobacteriota bacterium]
MNRVFHVAAREFVATVATKGFIIGALILPLTIAVVVLVLPHLINERPPKVEGELALLDRTGEVAAGVQEALSQQAISDRWSNRMQRIAENAPGFGKVAGDAVAQAMLADVPDIRVTVLPPGSDLEAAKSALVGDTGRLGLAVVSENAVRPSPAGEFGGFDLFLREKLDDRVSDEMRAALRESVIAARARAKGLDPDEVQSFTRVGPVTSTTVGASGERSTNELLNMFLPAGMMVLLIVSVMTGGQYLMTTTVEEKSSRVVEVLLSAVSPMQLMTGKIIGQMCVGLLLMAIYAGMGVFTLASFALFGLIDPWLFVYLIVFYAIAYFTMAAFMAAIGAAVNEMREAQSLMTPVIMIMMIPWLFWMPITRDPNSTFATVMSFIPPLSSFVMMLRLASNTPPPFWQVALAIAIGIGGVYASLWCAAKIFRIGLLMYGKPPNFMTLIRWVRMA